MIYYVKSGGGTGSGLDDENAWSYAKFKSTTLAAGDTVLFKRGDTFYGSFTAKSGTDGSPTVYSAYGTGENPVFTGLLELDSWTLESGNIYYAILDVPRLNMVLLDGDVQGMGRYPNTGYLQYTGHTGNTSINGTTIGAIPFDPSGGEVVIRKYRWIIDRQPITSRLSNTLNYSAANEYGNNSNYSPLDDNGYFIQSHLSTLDQEGEWYYDTDTNRLYMHFGSGTPSGRLVKAASIDRNIVSNSRNYVNFSDLTIEGANLDGLYIPYTGNINVTNCKFINQGGNAIYGLQGIGVVTIDNITVENSLNNGIFAELDCDNWTITNSKVTDIQMIAVMGKSGDASGNGISISGNNSIIENNVVINSGYNGISIYNAVGSEINNNTVNTFCTVKDDGAGIYMVTSDDVDVENNNVYNAIGAYEGSESASYEAFGKAAGIYLDDFSSNINVLTNYVKTGDWAGIFIHDSDNSIISNNNVLDYNQSQLYFLQDVTSTIFNNTVIGNKFSATSTQKLVKLHNYINGDNPYTFATFSNNRYFHDSTSDVVKIHNEYSGGNQADMTLSEWKELGQDIGSVSNPKLLKSGNKILIHEGKILITSE